ncbi:MAG: DUF1761 domain-containing protein [Alphaproteobacteria bacterium]|nr:DUF1761 domain-containing protein [Alphaproteobacteria bacterium]
MFGKKWMALAGLTEEQAKSGSIPMIFGGAFALSVIAAAVFSMFLGPKPELGFALGAGSSAGLCWVATGLGINYLFERKPLGLFLINGGYFTVQFTLIGLILSVLG